MGAWCTAKRVVIVAAMGCAVTETSVEAVPGERSRGLVKDESHGGREARGDAKLRQRTLVLSTTSEQRSGWSGGCKCFSGLWNCLRQ